MSLPFSRQTFLTLFLLLTLAIGGGATAWRTTTLNKEIAQLNQEVVRLSQEGERLTAEAETLRATEGQPYEPITSPIDTSTWKTYRGLTFEVKYPDDIYEVIIGGRGKTMPGIALEGIAGKEGFGSIDIVMTGLSDESETWEDYFNKPVILNRIMINDKEEKEEEKLEGCSQDQPCLKICHAYLFTEKRSYTIYQKIYKKEKDSINEARMMCRGIVSQFKPIEKPL